MSARAHPFHLSSVRRWCIMPSLFYILVHHSQGSAIWARKYFEINAVFLLISILHNMSSTFQEVLFENPWHKVTGAEHLKWPPFSRFSSITLDLVVLDTPFLLSIPPKTDMPDLD